MALPLRTQEGGIVEPKENTLRGFVVEADMGEGQHTLLVAAMRSLMIEITLGHYVDRHGHRLAMTAAILRAQSLLEVIDILQAGVMAEAASLRQTLQVLVAEAFEGDYRNRAGEQLTESGAFASAARLVRP